MLSARQATGHVRGNVGRARCVCIPSAASANPTLGSNLLDWRAQRAGHWVEGHQQGALPHHSCVGIGGLAQRAFQLPACGQGDGRGPMRWVRQGGQGRGLAQPGAVGWTTHQHTAEKVRIACASAARPSLPRRRRVELHTTELPPCHLQNPGPSIPWPAAAGVCGRLIGVYTPHIAGAVNLKRAIHVPVKLMK